MVELFKQDIRTYERQSSKGNQLKWMNNDIWYKADYTGYEGLSEYAASKLLQRSTLDKNEYVVYDTEEIQYNHTKYLGCKSSNFLPEGWMLITLERLFNNMYGHSLNKSIYSIEDYKGRIQFMVEQTIRITGLKAFGAYVSKLLTVDALFLNEDRHTHNIAVLIDNERKFHYCPIFDNGAALLSDTTMDYPMGVDVNRMIGGAKAKTFCSDFDEQLDVVEQLYGQHISFSFSNKDIEELLVQEPYYPEEIKIRVREIILQQKRKYQYLFQ